MDFIPTILMNLRWFNIFLSNKFKKKNGKYIRIETKTNKYILIINNQY